MSSILRKQFVSKVWKDMLTNGGVEKVLFDRLDIISVRENEVVARLPVEKKHTNRLGIMQGGVMATLVDIGGSLAVSAKGMYQTGVSTDIAVTYIGSGGRPGDELEVRCYCQRLGRSMGYTFVEMYNPKTNDLVARGNHTKYVAPGHKSDLNVKFDD